MLTFDELTQPPLYRPRGLKDEVVIGRDRNWVDAPWSIRVNGELKCGARNPEHAFILVEEMFRTGVIR